MNLVLAYDTETTGLPDFKAPSESAHQPHIVQLGAVLIDLDSRKTISSMDVIIRPDGWVIPDEVAAVHGITTEHALAVGIPERTALEMFMTLWDGRQLLGHNESFDRRILRIAQHRFAASVTDEQRDAWKACNAHCTQLLSTPILKLPPTAKMLRAGFTKNKSANLREAYEFFMGTPLADAHSAMADCRAALDVFFAIQNLQQREAA